MQLHDYQEEAVTWLLDNPRGMLFGNPGVGKTPITLHALAQAVKALPALVVAPLTVCHNVWEAESAQWDLGFSFHLWHDTNRAPDVNADIILVNPDNLAAALEHCKRWGVRTLILDEQSLFKNPSSQRFKKMRQYASSFKRAWGLTGTPTPHGLYNLWSQTLALGLKEVFNTRSFHKWRRDHFYPKDYNQYIWELKPGEDVKLYDKVRPYAHRITDEHLVLPELRICFHEMELDQNTMNLYRYIKRKKVIPWEFSEPLKAAVVNSKLRQLCTGAVYDSSDTPLVLDPQTKLSYLTNVIEPHATPVLVFFNFTHEANRLTETLHARGFKKVYRVDGNTPYQVANDTLDRWNDGGVSVLLAQPQSIGHGVNLQRSDCRTVVYASPMYDYELYDQSVRRVYRQGCKEPYVEVHNVLCKDTVEYDVMGKLAVRRNTQDRFLAAIGEDRPVYSIQ